MDATFHGGLNDTIGGQIYHRFVPICKKNRPLSSIHFIISEKFIGGVVDTGEGVNSLSAVSLKPAITFFPGVVDTGQKFAEIFANECLSAVSTPP